MDTEFLAQFRRLGRIVVVSAVSGVMLGALGMFALVPSRTADVARAATKLIVDEIGIEPAAAATTMPTAALAGAPSAIEDTQAPATKADGFAERWASTRAGKTCKEGTWPYFDSECLWTASQKKRHARVPLKQRHVRVAPDSEQAAPTTGAEPSASTAAPSPAPTRT